MHAIWVLGSDTAQRLMELISRNEEESQLTSAAPGKKGGILYSLDTFPLFSINRSMKEGQEKRRGSDAG
jgi:hypothetical protein